jgi:hypothetical protein
MPNQRAQANPAAANAAKTSATGQWPDWHGAPDCDVLRRANALYAVSLVANDVRLDRFRQSGALYLAQQQGRNRVATI